jgi:hypothetical protein
MRQPLDLGTSHLSGGTPLQDERHERHGEVIGACGGVCKWRRALNRGAAWEGADIESGRGTIRGKRNGVRAKLEVLSTRNNVVENERLARLFEDEKKGKIVVYMTSVKVFLDGLRWCVSWFPYSCPGDP